MENAAVRRRPATRTPKAPLFGGFLLLEPALLRRTALKPKRDKPRRKGQPAPRIKPEQEGDPEHLARLRELGCWCCWVDHGRWVAAEAHHPKRPGLGMAVKAPDSEAIPLCSRHHNEQHPDSLSVHRNPIEWRARYGTEEEVLAHVLLALSKIDR